MRRILRAWISGLLLLVVCCDPSFGLESVSDKLLAAMPVLEKTMTRLDVWTTSNDLHLSVSRAVLQQAIVQGLASTNGSFDLHLRVLVPLHVAPAFLAVEFAPTRVTGLMTLFFGPVSVDLGRTWLEPSRWAFVQLVVHPRLTMVFGGIQQADAIVPYVGWRLFPSASAQWEIGMLFNRNEIRLSVGGVL